MSIPWLTRFDLIARREAEKMQLATSEMVGRLEVPSLLQNLADSISDPSNPEEEKPKEEMP